ncbi:dioxygenase domain-containing protein [Sarocladium implicatum]|nr:dioxygenase domain-containing protein [Sarocladium implicatum]
MSLKSALLATTALAGFVLGHPGHDPTEEMMERREFIQKLGRSDLSHCTDKLAARGVTARNAARRAAAVQAAREKRGLKKRDLEDVLNKNHNQTDLGYTPETAVDTLFSGNTSCLLHPEVTQGPYYVGGEFIRSDVTDEQEGVPIMLDYQVIDVDTCEPIPEVHLELWHCNATGVYSGVIVQGNGDANDKTNIDKTFLRGIQKTDSDGVARFESVYPGHYTGRTIHNHLLVHTNAKPLGNGTLGNDVTASHVGQAYFDQDLSDEVEKEAVYQQNEQPVTRNEDDFLLKEGAADVDPIHEYVLLGDKVSDGLFAWLAFGVQMSSSQAVEPAVNYYKEGGVVNPNAGGGFGPPPTGGDAEKRQDE